MCKNPWGETYVDAAVNVLVLRSVYIPNETLPLRACSLTLNRHSNALATNIYAVTTTTFIVFGVLLPSLLLQLHSIVGWYRMSFVVRRCRYVACTRASYALVSLPQSYRYSLDLNGKRIQMSNENYGIYLIQIAHSDITKPFYHIIIATTRQKIDWRYTHNSFLFLFFAWLIELTSHPNMHNTNILIVSICVWFFFFLSRRTFDTFACLFLFCMKLWLLRKHAHLIFVL